MASVAEVCRLCDKEIPDTVIEKDKVGEYCRCHFLRRSSPTLSPNSGQWAFVDLSHQDAAAARDIARWMEDNFILAPSPLKAGLEVLFSEPRPPAPAPDIWGDDEKGPAAARHSDDDEDALLQAAIQESLKGLTD